MKSRISKAYAWAKAHYVWSIIILIILVITISRVLGGNGNGDTDVFEVKIQDFLKTVAVAGKVIPAQSVDLGFEVTGKVVTVSADVGERVAVGQVIARLDSGTYSSELQKAQAGVLLKQAEYENEEVNFEKVTDEQNTLVKSAYTTLLSEGLEAVPDKEYGLTAPTIGGSYVGPEGEYKVRVLRKNPGSDEYKILTFEMERTEIEVEDNEPTPLGTYGLHISFPNGINGYDETIWHISIPNTKSNVYLSNYNEYQEALHRREREVAAAKAAIESGTQVSVAQSEIAQSQAEVNRILSEIEKRTIRAPFAGLVTRQDAKVGKIVNANDSVITLISHNAFQIETFVPEINIKEVQVGNIANVTLDAYGDEVVFEARVVSVDPGETIRDGVSTYKVLFEFTSNDDRLKSGMTANVVITTELKPDAILIPQESVVRRDGYVYVIALVGKEKVEKQITTGAVASNGYIEVLAGLSQGEVIVKNAQ